MRFDEDGRFQVWAANPDMTRQVQLTHGPDWDGWFPSWSPDGTRIAFSSYHEDPDPFGGEEIHDVYTMKADGTDVRKITDSRGYNGKPSWSPDGRWLLFDADRGDYPASQGIYIIRSDGSGGPRRVTSLPTGLGLAGARAVLAGRPRIVFNQVQGGHEVREPPGRTTGRRAGRRVHGPARRVGPAPGHARGGCTPATPTGPPTADDLVFSGQPSHTGNIGDIHVSGADGGAPQGRDAGRRPHGPGQRVEAIRYSESFNPAWSPDGTTIVFVHAEFTAEDGFHMGLQVMNPDGSGRHWLSEGEEHQPDWGSAPLLN